MAECSGRSGGGCLTEILAGFLLWWLLFGGGCTAVNEWTKQHAMKVEQPQPGKE